MASNLYGTAQGRFQSSKEVWWVFFNQTFNVKLPLKFEVYPELLLLNRKTAVAVTQEDRRKINEQRENKNGSFQT